MASSFNLTIEDGSPLITYGPSGAWQDASAQNTAGLPYSGSSLHSTTTRGATATVNFKGTGVEFYGGFRPSYGTYTLLVDGNQVASGTSTSDGVETRKLLGSASGLANGEHTAVLTSTGVGMDLDFVNLITQVGAAGSTTTATLYDDANPAITYAGNWATTTSNAHLNNTIHYSESSGSAAMLSFSGSAVAVYGTVSPDHANVQISVDGKQTLVNTQASTIANLHAQTLLYYANDLDEKQQHTLIVTNPGQQDGTGPFIDLDGIAVFSASVPGVAVGQDAPGPSTISNQSDNNNNPNAASQSRPKSGLSGGAIAGIIIAIVLVLLAVLGLILFLARRRRKRWQKLEESPRTPIGAALPLQGPNMRFTPVSPQQPMPTFSGLVSRMSAHSIAPSYYGGNADTMRPPMSAVPTLTMPRVPSRAQQTVMMGNLVWHEYARLVSITASAYAVWASYFALFYRKFFWDFVGGILRDPGGIQPSPSASIFISIIVKAPIVPIISAVLGLFILAVENPLPLLKDLSIRRSLIFKVILLVFQALLTILFYQGTNAALWSLVAIFCYIRAIALGETIEEAKANRGKGGRA
ncbi:hypothetical protein R3P38DRAFT_3603668 [Favolaschia claudopus]|uniref:DUF7727 domain-containing protein n=1 Tax=Favolaschia claudopus TaxID=2862362 RepID=A0AAW0AAD5_9AGAR